MAFEKGKTYTRQDIAEAIGGGSVHDYLPEKEGKILCACLSQAFDPEKPVILVGQGPGVQRQAELFCGQQTGVPVFFKKQANQWEYAGEYRCDHWTDDLEEVLEYEQASGRSSLTKVVFLKAA